MSGDHELRAIAEAVAVRLANNRAVSMPLGLIRTSLPHDLAVFYVDYATYFVADTDRLADTIRRELPAFLNLCNRITPTN